jgi:hypothetical protein
VRVQLELWDAAPPPWGGRWEDVAPVEFALRSDMLAIWQLTTGWAVNGLRVWGGALASMWARPPGEAARPDPFGPHGA